MKPKSDWKVTNRGKRSYKYRLLIKSRKSSHRYWIRPHEMHFGQFEEQVIRRQIWRWYPVKLEDLPPDVQNEVALWKMEHK